MTDSASHQIDYKTPAKHWDIFRDTLIAKKYGEEKIEPMTYWLGNTKKFHVPARVRTHDLLATEHFTRWSGDKVEFWQNLYKNASQIAIFLPHLRGRKLKNSSREYFIDLKKVLRFQILKLSFVTFWNDDFSVRCFEICPLFSNA